MNAIDPPPIPRPATSVLLLRDGAGGLEVFMATRHERASFMPGVMVFPGGRVDPEDSDRRLLDGLAPYERLLDDLEWRLAGIRELFEEAGFLLARKRGGPSLVLEAQLAAIAEKYRTRLRKGDISFAAMVEEAELAPAPGRFVPFAHWITPKLRMKRFDTRFYAAMAPDGQTGLHDDDELVDSRWVRPADALAEADSGKIRLVFATRSNLRLLAKSTTAGEALEAAANRPVRAVEPEPFDAPGGPSLRIPADAGYEITEILLKETGL